jgi:hypothetical protein
VHSLHGTREVSRFLPLLLQLRRRRFFMLLLLLLMGDIRGEDLQNCCAATESCLRPLSARLLFFLLGVRGARRLAAPTTLLLLLRSPFVLASLLAESWRHG